MPARAESGSATLCARAMRHERVERVPVMCQLALGHYFLQSGIPAVDIWHSSEGFGEALVTLQRRYGFDGILVNLPGRDPHWRRYIRRIEQRENETVIHWENGWHTVCPADDNPHAFRADGREYRARFEEVRPEELYYIEPHDLGGLKYPFAWGFSADGPDPDNLFPPWQYDTIDYVIARAGKDVSVHGEIFSPFTQFLELLGYDSALLALIDDPVKTKVCLEALVRGTVALGRGQAAHGVEAVLISSAFAGAGFISPKHYAEFVLPYEKMVIKGIKAAWDLPIYTHTCGRIGDRLELIAATGTDGIDTLDPPPLGDVDLGDAKRRIGGRLFIKGNIDPVHVILRGTPESVYSAARHCLEIAAPGGGYILSSACSIPPHAPPENILMLRRASEDFAAAA